MKYSKAWLSLAVLALGTASAANVYHLKISDPAWVGSNELKPGEYRVDVEGNKAIIEQGKMKVEVQATMEKNSKKYSTTAMITENKNGKKEIDEIQFGGSTTRLIFHAQGGGAGGSE